MVWRDIRWERVLLSFIVGLIILFGANKLNTFWRVEKPLEKKILLVNGVKKVRWEKKNYGLVLYLTLGDLKNLQQTVETAVKLAEEKTGLSVTEIILHDKPNEKLLNVFYEQHFFISEAAVKGNFGEMKKFVEEIAARAGIADEKVYIGENYLFVQIKDDFHYLYRIIKRQNESVMAKGGNSSI